MKETTIRKQLGLIDYNNIPQDYVYIGRLPSPFSDLNSHYEIVADFFIGNGFLINRKDRRQNNVVDGGINQFEIPWWA